MSAIARLLLSQSEETVASYLQRMGTIHSNHRPCLSGSARAVFIIVTLLAGYLPFESALFSIAVLARDAKQVARQLSAVSADQQWPTAMAATGYTKSQGSIPAVSTKHHVSSTSPIVQTFLGPIEKSTVIVSLPGGVSATGIHGNTYLNTDFRFQISWPDNLRWTANEALGKEMLKRMVRSTADVPIIISWKDRVAGSAPSVNVVTARVGNIPVLDWMNASASQLTESGWHIQSIEIDEASQGGILVSSVEGFSQVQRFALASGMAYVVTATMPTADVWPADPRGDLLSVINSFRLLKQ